MPDVLNIRCHTHTNDAPPAPPAPAEIDPPLHPDDEQHRLPPADPDAPRPPVQQLA